MTGRNDELFRRLVKKVWTVKHGQLKDLAVWLEMNYKTLSEQLDANNDKKLDIGLLPELVEATDGIQIVEHLANRINAVVVRLPAPPAKAHSQLVKLLSVLGIS
jgi:hypothetical protein